jgi:eukaryotic-like serine/threonine-protein kinase
MVDTMPGDIFRPGQILNHTYEIEAVLGRGGTGEVYRARNLVTGRVVAVKALNQQFSGNNDYVELMKREEQMRDIVDDAVVRYTECSRSDEGRVFLVMDFIDGPSLNDLMVRERLDARELMVIAHRVAGGLVAAHRQGIVHRDLSPDNIILRDGRPERATIIDFGIAKDTAAGARTIVGNEFAGKYEYAAPEQLEGKAERRSDFYALGALLLAAYRGAIPFEGTTPGEIIRRKQTPLDTSGVAEPLKALIDWLAAPDLAARPASADDIVQRLERELRPAGKRGTVEPAGDRNPKRAGMWLALAAAVGVVALAAYFLAPLVKTPLQVADPYVFQAALSATGQAELHGNAPDAQTATDLRAAFAKATGQPPAPDALTLATGMPSEGWPAAVISALGIVTRLQDWRLDLSGPSASVSGLAANAADRESIAAALQAWADAAGFTLRPNLVAGPRSLAVAAILADVSAIADCGPLATDRAPGQNYALGDTVIISGPVESSTSGDAIQKRLSGTIGDRRLRVEVTPLNTDLCIVRRALPPTASDTLSVWLGDGTTGAVNLTGVFHVDENPIVEVHAPGDLTNGFLWVALVDNTGKVFNLLPNINDEEQDIAALGRIENGIRRIRVLSSIAEFKQNPKLLAMKISATDFGKSEIVAVLSKAKLFDIRRPRDESTASFAEALAEEEKLAPSNILAVATRLLDSRP